MTFSPSPVPPSTLFMVFLQLPWDFLPYSHILENILRMQERSVFPEFVPSSPFSFSPSLSPYIYMCIYIYTHTHTHTYVCIYTHMYVYIYKYIQVYLGIHFQITAVKQMSQKASHMIFLFPSTYKSYVYHNVVFQVCNNIMSNRTMYIHYLK